jgi:hypothetical protein
MSDNLNPASTDDVKETCSTLQHQLNSVLILTCVVSLTLTVYLGFQFRAIQREVQNLRTIATDHQTKTQPVLQDLSRKLVEFSKTNPDIKPILDKYGVAIPTNAPAPVKK